AQHLGGGQTPPTAITAPLIAVGVSAAAYFVLNTGLTSFVIAIAERQSVVAVWRTNYSWMPLNFLATAVQGAALALAYQSLGLFGVLVFTAPPGAAWLSSRLSRSK